MELGWLRVTRSRDDRHALLVHLARVQLDRVGDDEDRGLRALGGREAQVAGAAGDHQADVAVGEVVGLHGLVHGRLKLLGGIGDLQADRPGRIVQAVEVGLALKDPAGVDADALEDAVAVEQCRGRRR